MEFKMESKWIAATIVSVGLGLSGYFIGQGFIGSKMNTQYVEVKGLAERVVKANESVWTINIKQVNNNLNELYDAVSKNQDTTKQFLLAQGFKPENISMNPIAITDNQSLSYNQNQGMPRYSADAGVTISTSLVDNVAQAIQKTGDLVAQGVVVTSSNVVFRYTELNSIKRPMLEEATKSARNAAESFAMDSKTSLGKIRHASQGLFTITDANSTFDSGNSILKKVRIVTTIEYQLNDN